MSVLTDTPHTVTQKRPARDKDSATNATSLDYANPTLERDILGLFQSRGGVKAISDEGEEIPFDSMFFSLEQNIQADDLLEVDLGWVSGNFIVISAEPKPDLDGIFDHMEALLQKDTKL